MIFILKFELKDGQRTNRLKSYIDNINEKNHTLQCNLEIEKSEIIFVFNGVRKSTFEFLSLPNVKLLNDIVKHIKTQFEIDKIRFYIKDLTYQERITRKSKIYQKVSPNNHNRIMMYIKPLNKEVESIIDNWDIKDSLDLNERKKALKKATKLKKKEIAHIIDIHLGNILVNDSSQQQRIDNVKSYFIEATRAWFDESILVKEPAIGFKVIISDINIHSNPRYTQYFQIASMIFSVMGLAVQDADIHLFEPIHIINFSISRKNADTLSETRMEVKKQNIDYKYERFHVECPTETLMKIIEVAKEIFEYQFIGYKKIPTEFEEKIILEIRKSKGLI